MLELAITWLPYVGAATFGLGITAWYAAGASKSVAIWAGFIGFVFAAAGLSLHLQKLAWQEDGTKPDQSSVQHDRAYVHVFDGEIIHPVGSAPTVSVMIRNSGHTTALDLTWTARFILADPSAPETEFTFSKHDTSPAALGPGGTMFYRYTFDAWNPDFDDLIEKRKAVFFAFGQIRYKDVFGNLRFSDYRLLGGGRYDIGKGIAPSKWGVADKGNASD
jgi:hypothetical protein